MNENELLKKFIDFFSSYTFGETNEELFMQIDYFLQNSLQTSPLIVCSTNIEKKLNLHEINRETVVGALAPLGKLRVHWNRELDGSDIYSESVLNHMQDIFLKKDFRAIAYLQFTFKENKYLVFYLGQEEEQSYFGLVKINSEINFRNHWTQFVSFCDKIFNQLMRWKALNKSNQLIHLDDVTGLYNQRKLYKDLDQSIDLYNKTKEGFVILFIDIDHFKHVNDGHGHIVGTQVLKELGAILKDVLRETDYVYRYGGDEFVTVLTHSNTCDAKKVGERVLHAITKKVFEACGIQLKISVSIGIARFPHDAKSTKEVLEIADKMMYYAKSRGRSRVCLAEEYLK